jgi:tetratricopeptide (TPR) repeat protein
MNKKIALFFSLTIAAALAVSTVNLPHPAIANQPSPHSIAQVSPTQKAPLFNDLGNHHYPISTQSKQAQRYFDQGLVLAYGFNHAEAARSFKEAAKLDAKCAMCYWGLAYVLGPNINAAMAESTVPEAWQAIQKAIELSEFASDRERAYIQALAKRYVEKPVADRKPLDIAYANAMRDVVKRYPDDLEAGTLFAEALMDTTPWDYWDEKGNPKPEGAQIMAVLESVLKRNPNHPGANHLYIHAVEKERPELGIPAADRLMTLVPGAGHLVHMASHIYIRVGRYHDAVLSNQRGIAADDAYVAACHAQGVYQIGYMPHNHHFLWFAALMTGQSQLATEAALHTAKVDPKMMRQPEMAGALQHFYTIPLFTYARFGQWNEILATAAPDSDLKYPNGVRHFARGLAFIAKGQLAQASQELQQLKAIANAPELKDIKIWGFNATSNILNIATEVLASELAAKQGQYDFAIAHLQKAVQLEDALVYTEPADWYYPTRQALGGVLLKANRPAEAEQIYREELKIYPENGWSLYGLVQSLQAQNKTKQAQAVQQQFNQAWKYADVQIASVQR